MKISHMYHPSCLDVSVLLFCHRDTILIVATVRKERKSKSSAQLGGQLAQSDRLRRYHADTVTVACVVLGKACHSPGWT